MMMVEHFVVGRQSRSTLQSKDLIKWSWNRFGFMLSVSLCQAFLVVFYDDIYNHSKIQIWEKMFNVCNICRIVSNIFYNLASEIEVAEEREMWGNLIQSLQLSVVYSIRETIKPGNRTTDEKYLLWITWAKVNFNLFYSKLISL